MVTLRFRFPLLSVQVRLPHPKKGSVITKRILAVILALSLLVVSVSAADVYELEDDTHPYLVEDGEYDYDFYSPVMTLDLTEDESDKLSQIATDVDTMYYLLNSVNTGVYTISDYLSGDLYSELYYQSGLLEDIFDVLNDSLWTRLGTIISKIESTNNLLVAVSGDSYLTSSGSVGTLGSDTKITSVIRVGLMGLASKFDTLNKLLVSAEGESYLTSSGAVGSLGSQTKVSTLLRVGLLGLGSKLDSVSSSVTTMDQNVSDRLVLESGNAYLSSNGVDLVLSGSADVPSVLSSGFRGLGSLLRSESGDIYLSSSGLSGTLTSATSLDAVLRAGFLGVRSLVAGSEEDNVYSGTITSNANVETEVTATGLGPMLNQWLDAIQLNTANLAYMFASPEDLEAKKESLSTTKAVTDSFLSGDAEGAKISLSTVSDVKDIADGATDLFNSGYGITDLFTIWDDTGMLSWFSSETAYALDTTVQALAVDDEDPYNMQIYYDQINAIAEMRGEGNDG